MVSTEQAFLGEGITNEIVKDSIKFTFNCLVLADDTQIGKDQNYIYM
jgi:hypothetical protein